MKKNPPMGNTSSDLSVTPNRDLKPRLKKVRESFGLSQKAMDDHLQIGKNSWQRYESVGQVPGGEVLAKLVEKGINANWLLTGEGEMKRFSQESMGPVDIPVLERILLRVGEIEREENADWEPHLKAKLIAAVYDYVMEEDVSEADRTKEIGRVISFIRKVG